MDINLSLEMPAPVEFIWNYIGNFKEPEKWNPIYVKSVMQDEITRKSFHALRYPINNELVERLLENNSSTHTLRFECLSGFQNSNEEAIIFKYSLSDCGSDTAKLDINISGLVNPELHKKLSKWASIVAKNIQNLCKSFNYSKSKWKQISTNGNHFQFANTIDVVESSISVNEFVKNYLNQHRPVIIRNYGKRLKHYDKLSSFDWWKQVYGENKIEITVGETPYEESSTFITTFSEYLSHLCSDQLAYLSSTYNLPQEDFVGLREFIKVPEYIPNGEVKNASFWAGPKGIKTLCHQDNFLLDRTGKHPYLTHNLNLQLKGHKRWVIAAPEETINVYGVYEHKVFPFTKSNFLEPDFSEFPLLKKANLIEFNTIEGDLLYIPAAYWHAIEYIEDSINLNFLFFAKTTFQESHPNKMRHN